MSRRLVPAFVAIFAVISLPGSLSAQDRTRPATRRTTEVKRPDLAFAQPSLPTPTLARLASGAPGPGYWQQQADYRIEARLDEAPHLLTAKETITYTNRGPNPLDYIWVHLERNIDRADSLAARANGAAVAEGATPEKLGPGIRLGAVRSGGKDLVVATHDTIARIDLAEPVAGGGGTVAIELAWSFEVPGSGAGRMGIEGVKAGEIFELAQWFPAVCVYDDIHGWNTLPYLGNGEFYTNFGNYDVMLTVPRSHLVGATGVLQNEADVLTAPQRERLTAARRSKDTIIIRGPEEVANAASRPPGPGTLTWHFKAENTRSFAWATSAAFIWDAAAAGSVLVQSLYPAEGLPLWSKATDMLRFSIERYSARWFQYPYPVATNVNGIAGGMEYPMIIFCADRGTDRDLYFVTTHEIGHNWFPMTVNTDERRHAWMDEGFNTFINYYSVADRFGAPGGMFDVDAVTEFMRRPDQPPIDTPADLNNGPQLGVLQYWKPARGLIILREDILGPERFDVAFREYIRRWAFKSPQPADFFRTMEDAAGVDLGWFWRGWFLETGTVDQAIVAAKPGTAANTVLVTIANEGDLPMPVHLRVTFADGTHDDYRYPSNAFATKTRFTTTIPTGGRPVTELVLDPNRHLPDQNRTNNRKKL